MFNVLGAEQFAHLDPTRIMANRRLDRKPDPPLDSRGRMRTRVKADGRRPPERIDLHHDLRISLTGHPEEALPHLRRVQEHGNLDDFEYGLALVEIDRIEGRKADSTRP
jgi:hypothetical protein